MQQQQHQHQRAAIFDTPTPPSQSYSQTVPSAVDPLQTSLKPRYPAVVATAGAKSHTPFKRVTSTPAAGLLKQQQQKRSHLNEEMEMDLDSTFTTSDFGGAGGVAGGYATHTNNENVDPMNRSVGLGNAGNGLGMHDKQRFLDLQQRQQHGHRTKDYTGTARVDEYSDATLDGSTASDTDQRSTSSEEDELAARLGINNNNNRQYGQPRGQHQNVSKSAFDGMARELRKEFERIMESGKKPSPNAAASGISPAQQRPYSLQAPSMPLPSSHANNLAANPVALPRGVPPPSKQQRASPLPPTRTASSYLPGHPHLERRDSTPTTVRTFGQELHVPRQQQQQQQQNAIPSPRFVISPKSALKQPQQQQHAVSYATSPFQVSSTAPTSGILPPNNTRATAKSASPVLQQQPKYLQDSFSPRADAQPVRRAATSSPYQVRVPDITGLTEGLTSPSRVTSGPSSHRDLPKDRSSHILLGRSQEDPALSSALVGLRQRLEALESENARSEAKVAELEDKLASRAVDPASTRGTREDDLVQALKAEIERLQGSIEEHAVALVNLQDQQAGSLHARQQERPTYARQLDDQNQTYGQSWHAEFLSLRDALGHLTEQVAEVKKVLEEVLESLRQQTVPAQHPRDQELLRPQPQQHSHVRQESLRDRIRPSSPSTPSRRTAAAKQRLEGLVARSPPRQHLHAQIGRHHSEPPYYLNAQGQAGLQAPSMQRGSYREPGQEVRASSAPPPVSTNVAYRVQRPTQARTFGEHTEPLLDRAERILAGLPPRVESHASTSCEVCKRREAEEQHQQAEYREEHQFARQYAHPAQRTKEKEELPMQTVISRALRDLEDDFAAHKRIYIELSEEYKLMDPATPDVGKRKILAEHLKESIDVLELKADEIKRLYDLLHYRGEAARERQRSNGHHHV